MQSEGFNEELDRQAQSFAPAYAKTAGHGYAFVIPADEIRSGTSFYFSPEYCHLFRNGEATAVIELTPDENRRSIDFLRRLMK